MGVSRYFTFAEDTSKADLSTYKMAILKYLSLFQLANASTTWILRDLTSQCGLGGTSSISFNYYPAHFSLKEDSFVAGDCGYSDVTISYGDETDIDGKHFKQVTMSYDPAVCSPGTNPVEGDLSTYSSETEFQFDTGVSLDSQFLSFRTHVIPAKCTYQSSYNLEYNFGELQKKTDYGETDDNDPSTPDVQSTEGGIIFEMVAYSDSARTSPITEDITTAGDLSYVTISPNTALPAGFSFAPAECQLIEVDSSCTENCNSINSFSLFNPPDNSCQTSEDLLGFAMSYDNSDTTWDFQFMQFLFNPMDVNNYKLVCDIRICAASGDPTTTCNAVAKTCLHSNAGDFFTECQSDQVFNVDTSSCEDAPTTSVDWSSTTATLSAKIEVGGMLSYAIVFDDDHIYFPGRVYDGSTQTPYIWAYGKNDQQLKKRYTYGTGSYYFCVAVNDKYVIATLYAQLNPNGKIVVFDKETTEMVSVTPRAYAAGVVIDGDNVVVASHFAPQVIYKITESGELEARGDGFDFQGGRAAAADQNLLYLTAKSGDTYSILGYDKSTLALEKELAGHTSFIMNIQFYGDYLISNSNKNGDPIRIWNAQTGTLLKTVTLDASIYALHVKDGFIFTYTWQSTKIEIRDLNKILDEDNDAPVQTIESDLLDGTWTYCINYNTELQQIFVSTYHGDLFIFET